MSSTKDARPNDLIGITRAAAIAERSERTIRRWASPSVGKLRRWVSQPPDRGGPAPVLVSERELMTVLAVSGQEPRTTAQVTPADSHPARPPDVAARPPDSVHVAVLEGRLQVAELAAELAAVQAERDGLARQIEDLRSQVEEQRRRWDLERTDHRTDLDAERDRSRALVAELMALREIEGVSWWRKLISGPTAAPAIPEAK